MPVPAIDMNEQLRMVPEILGRDISRSKIDNAVKEAYLVQIGTEIEKQDHERAEKDKATDARLAELWRENDAFRRQLSDAGLVPNAEYQGASGENEEQLTDGEPRKDHLTVVAETPGKAKAKKPDQSVG